MLPSLVNENDEPVKKAVSEAKIDPLPDFGRTARSCDASSVWRSPNRPVTTPRIVVLAIPLLQSSWCLVLSLVMETAKRQGHVRVNLYK